MNRYVIAAAALALAAAAPSQAGADAFGPWSPAVELVGVNSPALDGCPFRSPGGRRLYIASAREPSFGGIDIWVAERATKDAPWGAPVNLGPEINSSANDFCPSPGRGGHFLFVSNRLGGCGTGTSDIYATRFRKRGGWEAPRNLGCTINSAADEAGPVRTTRALYFSSNRTGNSDIYMSRVRRDRIGPPVPVAELNSPFDDARPYVHREHEIVFDSNRPVGGQAFDIWSATRPRARARWSAPVRLGPAVNSDASETRASLSRDGTTLYFGSTRGASQDVYVSRRATTGGK
jgi:WD40 repeat protein